MKLKISTIFLKNNHFFITISQAVGVYPPVNMIINQHQMGLYAPHIALADIQGIVAPNPQRLNAIPLVPDDF